MTFGQWYLRRGRITRRTWWLRYTLPLAAFSVLASLADLSFGFDDVATYGGSGSAAEVGTGGPFAVLVSLLTLVPKISSTVTRLHDRSHSAWWLAWVFLPVAGVLMLLVQNGFLRGDGGPNRYGPPAPPGHPGSLPYRL
ncbi:Uncharacterized membrane protein YhaH, DUF805 family [Modestobacter sp. DSM 44400]|uniref:DUF805 domain-containing protein n=1 Tax=Modestobacter sp. DSM 44400 TaxID=1550230 RepID=UPI0008955185|nr:DUF805 domain-containing protein [Modestobacter sp. DSM 44400]SDX50145.1 Uncharacterized membrane protein YhaH, DUF805 family [Modestobacter sp. DSM 44400]